MSGKKLRNAETLMIYASDDASVTGNGIENTWEIQNYLSSHWPSRPLFCVDGRDLSFGFDAMLEIQILR